MDRICLILPLLAVSIFGCRSSEPYPEAWASPKQAAASADVLPLGRFSNHGTTNKEKVDAPTFSSLLFNRELEGFAIDNLVISQADDSGTVLRIHPHVGDIGLQESRFLVAERREGKPLRWVEVSDPRYVNAYDVTASLFMTGGAFMPLAEWTRYGLLLAEDGSLLVHLEEKALVDFFYFFPVPITDEIWLRFPVWQAEEDL